MKIEKQCRSALIDAQVSARERAESAVVERTCELMEPTSQN